MFGSYSALCGDTISCPIRWSQTCQRTTARQRYKRFRAHPESAGRCERQTVDLSNDSSVKGKNTGPTRRAGRPRNKPPKLKGKTQFERFVEAAKALEVNENGKAFERAINWISRKKAGGRNVSETYPSTKLRCPVGLLKPLA